MYTLLNVYIQILKSCSISSFTIPLLLWKLLQRRPRLCAANASQRPGDHALHPVIGIFLKCADKVWNVIGIKTVTHSTGSVHLPAPEVISRHVEHVRPDVFGKVWFVHMQQAGKIKVCTLWLQHGHWIFFLRLSREYCGDKHFGNGHIRKRTYPWVRAVQAA